MSSETTSVDVAIIGAGPAGMTAGIYASRAGMKALVFEGLVVGGQTGVIKTIDNYPGFAEGIGGFELAWAMKQQAERFGTQIVSERVVSADLQASPKVITTDAGTYSAQAVIIATGARSRKLGIPQEDELIGHGVSYCATCDGNFFKGKHAVVYGSGDAALEDALYLANICARVTLVSRKAAFDAAAIHVDAVEAASNIETLMGHAVTALHEENGMLAALTLRDVKTRETQRIDADALFVAIGNVPNSEVFAGQLKLSGEYVVAGEDCETSIAGVYAAGDVRTKKLRQVVTAVADGAVAAEAAAAYVSAGHA